MCRFSGLAGVQLNEEDLESQLDTCLEAVELDYLLTRSAVHVFSFLVNCRLPTLLCVDRLYTEVLQCDSLTAAISCCAVLLPMPHRHSQVCQVLARCGPACPMAASLVRSKLLIVTPQQVCTGYCAEARVGIRCRTGLIH